MKPFWRDEELSEAETNLLNEMLVAHHQSVFRDNPSSMAVMVAASGSHDFSKALAAGLMTIGGPHAPLKQTIRFLQAHPPENIVKIALSRKQRIPGWGHGFEKDGIDPIWAGCDEVLNREFHSVWEKISRVTQALHEAGKKIWPNPSCYTAATAIILGMPPILAPYLFIAGRLEAWAYLTLNNQGKDNLWE